MQFTMVLFSPDHNLSALLCLLSLSYQDLAKEHAGSHELSAEVQHLNRELQKAKSDLKATTDSLSQSQERIESLSQCLSKAESSLQLEKTRGSVDAASNSHSSDTSQTHTPDTSHLDQSVKAGKARNLSVTPDAAAAETERQLSGRLMELEKEVCISLGIDFQP